MKKLTMLVLFLSVILFCGCWEKSNYENDNEKIEASIEIDDYEEAPAFVKDWFYREFNDGAEFIEVEGGTREKALSIAMWVASLDYETEDTYQYQTTGETIENNAGDSSSLAWLAFHACLSNGIDSVSVEMVKWGDGAENYYCVLEDNETFFVIDDGKLSKRSVFIGNYGSFVYGFNTDEYWIYK